MRNKLNLNYNWKFHLGEIPYDPIRGHFDTYMHSKAQSGQNAALPLYYDSDFETVDLPHDYVIKTKPSKEYNESNGGYFRDNAWYRRNFHLDESERGKRFVLLFDGAGMKTEVFVNGHFAGSNESMYNSFYVDISPYVTYGEDINTVSVHIVNGDLEGWWYEGAGIYRSVHLIKTNAIAVDVWGLLTSPEKIDENNWNVKINTNIYNMQSASNVDIVYEVIDNERNIVATNSVKKDIEFGENSFEHSIHVEDPKLWSLEETNLYEIKTIISKNDIVLDEYSVNFGFRTIEFTADKGFFLNGKHVKLRGACIHQDHAHLGVAVPKSVLRFRLEQMKSCGMNGYRCAHNNPSPELLELCDELGILVLDENRWFNFSERTKLQIRNMCKRDMNSPCVIAWSVGNEEPLQATLTGKELVRQMAEYIHTIDKTRPATLALNGGFFDSYAAKSSEVVSVNYLINEYDKMHKAHPDKCIIATESGASRNSRGVYFETDLLKPAYDRGRVSFGSSYLDAITQSETHDFIAGTFVWAGMEYRGEAQWPILMSASGIFDNCGIEKDTYYMAKSIWTQKPMVHMLPHWDLQGHEGEIIEVNIYANTDEVELFINGISQGKKATEKYKYVEYSVEYQRGTAVVIGYNKGKFVAKESHHTSGEAYAIELVHKNDVSDNGEDILIVEAVIVDKEGNPLRNCNAKMNFEVQNGGKLIAVDGGNPNALEIQGVIAQNMYMGKLHAFVKVNEGAPSVSVKACAPEFDLKQKIAVITTKAEKIARVPICESMMEVNQFRVWKVTDNAKAVDLEYNFADMNTSEPVNMKNYTAKEGAGYEVYTGKTLVPKIPSEKTVCMNFAKLKGDVVIKIFHDTNCWPNPTPEEFKTYYKEVSNKEASDVSVQMPGFGANEKVNIVIQTKKDSGFAVSNVNFSVE